MNLKNLIIKYYEKSGDLGLEIKKYKNIKTEIIENVVKIINFKNNKDIINFSFYPIGSYDIEKNIWIWNFNNFSYDKNKIWINKIKEFNKKITNYDDFLFIEEINYYLSNDIFFIENEKIFDLVRLVNYILEGIGTFTIDKNQNNIKKIDFLIIKDINLDNR